MSFRTNRFGGAELVPFPRRTPSAAASEPLPPVLIVLHQESSTPGRAGNAFGVQFHPDVTYAMMHCWTTRGYDGLSAPGARERHHHFADRAVYDAAERAWLDQFIDGWLARRSVLAQAAE